MSSSKLKPTSTPPTFKTAAPTVSTPAACLTSLYQSGNLSQGGLRSTGDGCAPPLTLMINCTHSVVSWGSLSRQAGLKSDLCRLAQVRQDVPSSFRSQRLRTRCLHSLLPRPWGDLLLNMRKQPIWLRYKGNRPVDLGKTTILSNLYPQVFPQNP